MIQASSSTCSSSKAKDYYGSDDGFRYYSILYSEDYTGAGIFPEEKIVTCPIDSSV